MHAGDNLGGGGVTFFFLSDESKVKWYRDGRSYLLMYLLENEYALLLF